MKTLKYLIVPAMAGLLFVACNNEPKGPSQAELDTQVEAKVKAATDQLKADCDSRLMQAAQAQADSVLAKAKPVAKPKPAPAPASSTTKTTTKTTTKHTTTPVKETPKNPSNTTRPGSNQGTQNVPSNNHSRPGSNEATQQQKPENKPSNTSRPGANK